MSCISCGRICEEILFCNHCGKKCCNNCIIWASKDNDILLTDKWCCDCDGNNEYYYEFLRNASKKSKTHKIS